MLSAILAKKLGLLVHYLLLLIESPMASMFRSWDGFISLRIGNARLIGTREHVEQCTEVLEEFRTDSPDLYAALVRNRRFVFCCLPEEFGKGRVTPPPFFFNKD